MVRMVGYEATVFLKWIGDMLSSKWEMDYRTVMGWVRASLSFVILRATLLCVWGSCTKWQALGLNRGGRYTSN